MTQSTDIVTLKDAEHAIARLLAEARDKISEAEALADEFKTSFSFDLCYGAGATYRGDIDSRWGDDENGWLSSTASCY